MADTFSWSSFFQNYGQNSGTGYRMGQDSQAAMTQTGLGLSLSNAIKKSPTNTGSSFDGFSMGMKSGYAVGETLFSGFFAYKEAKMQKELLGLQADLSRIEERQYQNAAERVMQAGNQQVASVTFQAGQQKASTRVAQAGAGIRVGGTGSAAERLAGIDIAKEMEVNQILANTVVASYGYKRQQTQAKMNTLAIEAKKSQISPWAYAISTTINSAISNSPTSMMSFGSSGSSSSSSSSSFGSSLSESNFSSGNFFEGGSFANMGAM